MYTSWQAGWDPERVALVTPGGALTYGALHQRVRRATGWLRDRGLAPGQVLALAMPKSPAFLELNLAALRLGAATLPLNDRYTARELGHPLDDAPADLAVLPDALVALFPGAVPSSSVAAEIADAEPYDPPPPPLSALAVLLYTSGTTGRPKGVPLTGANLAATVEALHAAWRWSAEDVLLHALPLYHVHGLLVAAWGALRAGATSIWVDPFDAPSVLRQLSQGPATVFMGVPTFYSRMLEVPGSCDLRRMRLVTSGSAGLPSTVHTAFEARFGARIVERYGMTEIGIATTNPVDGERRPGSIGRPLPGVEVRVVADDAEVAVGEVGELQVRSPAVFSGYHRQPEATEAAFVDGFLRTGDLGHADVDGYLHLVGRRSELVIVGGFNVYPAEVEAVLLSCPGVREAAVCGVPDADLGETTAAVVVGDVDLEAIRARLRADLAPYKIPRRIELRESLPRNAMGKVVKSALFAPLPLFREMRDARSALDQARRASDDLATIDVLLAGGAGDLDGLCGRWGARPGPDRRVVLRQLRAALAPAAAQLPAAAHRVHLLHHEQQEALEAPEHAAAREQIARWAERADDLTRELRALVQRRAVLGPAVTLLGRFLPQARELAAARDPRLGALLTSLCPQVEALLRAVGVALEVPSPAGAGWDDLVAIGEQMEQVSERIAAVLAETVEAHDHVERERAEVERALRERLG